VTIAEKYAAVAAALKAIAHGADSATAPNLRPDLMERGGTADVTFSWGDETNGLYHIGYRRGATVVKNVVLAVIHGIETGGLSSRNRVNLSYNGYEAVLVLNKDSTHTNWLLTGWQKDVPDAFREPSSNPEATQTSLTFSRADLGAATFDVPDAAGEVCTHSGATQTGPTSSRSDLGAVTLIF
jgi:hypothetical protein